MSRNIGGTNCAFCTGHVVLEESPRDIKREECGVYYYTHKGYGFAGAKVANAHCHDCNAKYLAWVDLSACAGYGRHSSNRPNDGAFFDLSYRSTFDDEPGLDDLPDYSIEIVRTAIRKPWPVCDTCHKKIYYGYGCKCPKSPVPPAGV